MKSSTAHSVGLKPRKTYRSYSKRTSQNCGGSQHVMVVLEAACQVHLSSQPILTRGDLHLASGRMAGLSCATEHSIVIVGNVWNV